MIELDVILERVMRWDILEIKGVRVSDGGIPYGPGFKGWRISDAVTGQTIFDNEALPALLVMRVMAAASHQFSMDHEIGESIMGKKTQTRDVELKSAIELVNTHNRGKDVPIVSYAKCWVCHVPFAVPIAAAKYSELQGKPLICPQRECKAKRRRLRKQDGE